VKKAKNRKIKRKKKKRKKQQEHIGEEPLLI